MRDVDGTKEDFTELFHDQGTTDQFALMRTYRELGLDVPVRGDHVPEMAYDRELTPEGTPGYFTLGRLFANGYLKALLQGTRNVECVSHKERKDRKETLFTNDNCHNCSQIANVNSALQLQLGTPTNPVNPVNPV